MNEEEEKLEIHVDHSLPGIEEDTAVVADGKAVVSVVSATDTGEGKEEENQVLVAEDAEDSVLGLLSSGSVGDGEELPEEFDNGGVVPEVEVKEDAVHREAQRVEDAVHREAQRVEDPVGEEDDVHAGGGSREDVEGGSQLEMLEGAKDEILGEKEKEFHIQVADVPMSHVIDSLHLTTSMTEEKNGTAGVLVEQNVGNEGNMLVGDDADVSVNLYEVKRPNAVDRKDVKAETLEGDEGDTTVSDSYRAQVFQSVQQEEDDRVVMGPGNDILSGDSFEVVVELLDVEVGSATKEIDEKAASAEVGNAKIMRDNVGAHDFEGGQQGENNKVFTDSMEDTLQTFNAELLLEHPEIETDDAVEGKYENVESAKVDNYFIMSDNGGTLEIEGSLQEEVEEVHVVGSAEELATCFPQSSTKESENDKVMPRVDGVDTAEKADGSEANSLMLDEDFHLESMDEKEQVEIDKSLHVERSIINGKENAMELSQSDIMEELGEDVETKKSEGEAMMDHNVSEESQLLGSPVVLHSGEALSSASTGHVSVMDEDTVVEDLPVVVEDKDFTSLYDSVGGGRKKRGRPPKIQAPKPSSKKKVAEDVCFICFDGGNLVVCDRRGCPKVYHPSCVNRDEAFFRAKGRWNCGWHLCSICEKASQYMCYTCTYSLCKGCIKEAEFACIRGNKGLCESCRGTVMLIEMTNLEQKTTVNFDDKTSWEYLFKDYWLDLKEKLSLTLDDVTQAKKPSKRSSASNEQYSDERYEANADFSSDSTSGPREGSKCKRKRVKRRSRVKAAEENSVNLDSIELSLSGESHWASKELLEFVSHMRNGDVSVLSQFDVQPLLLEYIKRNNLRDPRKKSYIICDKRLEKLFGKARVGHFEMLKLLESHFLVKEASQVSMEENIGASGDPDAGIIDAEGSSDAATKISEKRHKARKKGAKGSLTNISDYAAVDVHNINLVYLRRNLIEELLDDNESFSEKVVGCFVRIRISGAGQKQDMYRLVQVAGTSKATEKYKTGKRTTDISLEILNLSKTEVVSIDSISNQEFTEEECKRLRQSIKCGLIRPMTVGDLQEKTMALQAIRVNDWLESEKLRLGHLRDRASETGRRKELRECVEKLQLLSTPEELSRRLSEVPDIHTDPNMDPAYESAEDDDSDDKRKDSYSRPRDSGSMRKGRELGSGRNLASHNSWNAGRNVSTDTYEQRNTGRDTFSYSGERTHKPIETPANVSQAASLKANAWSNSQSLAVSSQSSVPAAHSVSTSQSTTGTVISTASSVDETEKMWHYQDPSGKIQGPFSMVQLRKWNSTGYFPRDLKIWKSSETQHDSILLTDALVGKFQTELSAYTNSPSAAPFSVKPHQPPSVSGLIGTGVDTSAQSGNVWKSIVTAFHTTDHDRQFGNSPGQLSSSSNLNAQMENGSSYKLANNSNLSAPTARPSTGGWSGSHVVENKASVSIQPMTARWDVPANLEPSSSPSGVADHAHGSASRLPSQPAMLVTERPRKIEDGFGFSSSQNAAKEIFPKVIGNKSFSEMAIDVHAHAYPSPIYPSPTPNRQQRSSPESEHQKSLSSSLKQNLRGSDTTSFDLSESVLHKFPAAVGNTEPQKQFQKSEQVAMPQKVSSGDWVGIGSDLSMPSPTPTTDSTALEAGVTVVSERNPPAYADSSRNSVFSQRQAMPLYTADQTIGSREHQDTGRSGSENKSNNAGAAENSINVGRGTSVQGNTNISWGAVTQGASGVGWANQAQGNVNMSVGWVPAAQVNPTASAMWSTPGQGNTITNTGWVTPMQGNPNPNAVWGTAAAVNVHLNSNWVAPQGYSNLNPSWIAPSQTVQTNTNMNPGWAIPTQGNSNINTGYGNTNPSWNAPANPNSWSTNMRDDKDKHSGHTDRRFKSSESGFSGGRERIPSGPGGSSGLPDGGGQRGVCKYHESGHCKKGYSCNFLHT